MNLQGLNLQIVIIIIGVALLVIEALVIFILIRKKIDRAKKTAASIIEDAKREAETKIKEMTVEAQEKLFAAEAKVEEENKERRKELIALERKLEQREKNLDRKASLLGSKQQELERREREIKSGEQRITEKETSLQAAIVTQKRKLESISGMTAEIAKKELMKEMEEETRREAAGMIKTIEEEARAKAEEEALKIVTSSIQRFSSKNFIETTVTTIQLPNDEMKGRIIGREGRNIRSIEMATGIDLIIDDTPRTIMLSGFDPLRREIARIAIMRLVEDGRIHPARIEEIIEKVKEEIENEIQNAGEAVAYELQITDLHPRLAKLVGKLKFRTYLGHNLVQHSIEVAQLAAHMATELGAKAEVAKRAGLLHEIGHVAETNTVGSSFLLSAETAAMFGESDEVVHAIQSLHRDMEAKTVEAILLHMADKISDSRPGARKDNLEISISRLRKLEEIAASMKGVKAAYAIRAGKEVRVIVDSTELSDDDAIWLSKDIANRIKTDLDYPGQIRVSVIRETRAVDFAV
ncbi:MAG: ribonuclease Y [Acidobacteriota bacterium]